MEDKKLLDALKSAKLLDESEAAELLREAGRAGSPVEEFIYDRRLLTEEEVARAKSGALRIPYKKVNPNEISEELVKVIPAETARAYRVIPLSHEKHLLIVGMVDPLNLQAQEALKYLAKERKVSLGVYVVTPSDVENVLRKYGSYLSDINQAVQSLSIKPGTGVSELQRIVQLEESLGSEVDAPVIRIVSSLLKEAVVVGASDVHIEPQRSRVRVRFRLHGDLEEYVSFPLELEQPIISRVKVLSNLRLDETRIPQDGRFRTKISGREIDFRVSTFPTPSGEKVALRVLDPKTGLKILPELGVTGRNLELLKEGIEEPYGMVLITGPTGSGKTTTLYALLQILNKVEVNVVSLEDPVEYTVDGVNQSQVHPEIGYDFASGLRQILRQDPDVIMVGEIRDSETAALAVHSALTGHVVLSTLHTNNAVSVIPRLIDMKVEPFLLPSVLNMMVSQRLVSRLCEKCRKDEAPPPKVLEIIKAEIAKLPEGLRAKYKEPLKVWRAPGCSFCKNKGIVGRVALFEVFRMSPELGELIAKGPVGEGVLMNEAKRQGVIFLRADGVMKALDGLVNIEEVLKETEAV